MIRIAFLTLTAVLLAAAAPAGGMTDRDRLQGRWEIVRFTYMGQEVNSQVRALTFRGDQVVATVTGHEDEETRASVDLTTRPPRLSIGKFARVQIDEVRCLFKIENDTLTIIMGSPKQGGGGWPTGFDDPNCALYVYKRAPR